MKRISVLWGLFFVAKISWAGSPSSLNDLQTLKSRLKTIQAIHTHVEVYGQKLVATAMFESGDPQNPSACTFMKVDADLSPLSQTARQQQIQRFSQLSLSNPMIDTATGPDRTWSKFIFSSQSRVRRIDWYDQATGFQVQSAKFDDSGHVLTFDRYSHLAVNGPAASYRCGWTRFRKSGLVVEHQNASPDLQVAEFEQYSDLEMNYNLRMGLTQSLAGSRITLQAAAPSPTATTTATSKPTLQASQTTSPTPVPTLIPTQAASPVFTAAPTPQPSPIPTLVATAVSTQAPSPAPTGATSLISTPVPTALPTLVEVTPEPTALPTPIPTPLATQIPTTVPTPAPTLEPTAPPAPTPIPSPIPTAIVPTLAPANSIENVPGGQP